MTTHFFVQFLLCSESALARLLAKAIVSCSTEAPLPLGPPSCLRARRCVRWGLRGKYAAAREREANS